MVNNEHLIFQDIPLKGSDFHSAVLLTYSVDLANIDTRIRNILHKKKICSINILADKNQLDNSYSFITPLCINHLGRDYTISGIKCSGAFHPKINMIIGYDSLMCLIGSGNLTVGGQGKNHELFTGFMADKKNVKHLPLLHEIWSYIQARALKIGTFEKKRILEDIPLNCTLLKKIFDFLPHSLVKLNDDLEVALIYDDNRKSILSQIINIVPSSDVLKIIVVSPFFDKDGRALDNIQTEFPYADTDVLIQPDSRVLPYGLRSDRIKFFDFNKTPRGKKIFRNFQRTMHCKMIIFITKDKEYCFVGSANTTEAALGNQKFMGKNAEMCVLYTSSSLNFLKELDLEYHNLTPIELESTTTHTTLENNKKQYPIDIIDATITGSKLSICLSKSEVPSIDSIILDDGNNLISIKDFIIDEHHIIYEKTIIQKATMCYLVGNSGKRISNIVFINSISQLNITHPSKSNRELNGIISQIASEGYSGLEIVEILANIMSRLIEEQGSFTSRHLKSSESKRSDLNLPDINYNPEFNRKDEALFSNNQFNQIGPRLLNAIETCIKRETNALSNEILDEEEEAKSETSYARTEELDKPTFLRKKDITLYPNRVKALWDSYDKFLKLREIQVNDINFKIHHEDICFFILTLFSSLEICYLNRSLYKIHNLNNLETSNLLKKLFHSLDDIMGITGVNILYRFGTLLHNNKPSINQENLSIEGQRSIKYMLIFKYLFERMFALTYFRNSQITKIDEILKILIEIFGYPSLKTIDNELNPLIKKYNKIFELHDINNTLEKLRKR
ncbi:MAG: hypothetical protein HDT07_01285 [Bacteroidales bacterium]|nr:hypothetical protein [Bacteroidales bacterium]